MDEFLDPIRSHCLAYLPPFYPSQPPYKRQRHDIGPLSHRGLIQNFTMSTT